MGWSSLSWGRPEKPAGGGDERRRGLGKSLGSHFLEYQRRGRNMKISWRSGTPWWDSCNELPSRRCCKWSVESKAWAAVGKNGQCQFLPLSKGRDLAGPLQSILGPTALHTFFRDVGSFAICPTAPTHLPLSVPKLSLLQRSHRNVDACQATSWTFHSSPWLGGSKEAKWAGCLTVWVPNSPWNEWSSLLNFSNNHAEKQKIKPKRSMHLFIWSHPKNSYF